MRLTIAALLLAAIALPAAAAPSDYAAAVAVKGRSAEHVKLDESRKPAEILDFLQLRPDATVLDVMAGSGYYTQIAARAVGPRGSVIAFEPVQFYDDKSKAAWAEMVKAARNIRVMAVDPRALVLAPASVDFVLMHLTYHDLYWESEKFKFPRLDPDRVLADLYRAVKPGGVVGVIDHVGAAGDTRATVEAVHRIDPATVKADFQRAGFVLEGESDLLRVPSDDPNMNVFDPKVRGKTDRFVFRFRKPA